MSVPKKLKFFAKRSSIRYLRFTPFKLLAFGFFTYVLLGLIAISFPFAQKTQCGFVDNLFNVVSATSTTGLTVGSISESYSIFGQIVLLILIQLGAVGYMTLTSCLILARGDKLSQTRIRILGVEFALPEGLEIKHFVAAVLLYTLFVEALGAVALSLAFHRAGVEHPLWNGVFHSISAFGTAGFSLFSNGLESFRNNSSINAIVSALSLLGGIGFIVPADIWSRWTGRRQEITFTSKAILALSGIIVVVGTLVYFGCEGDRGENNLGTAFFQVVQASTTAGFNTVPIGALQPATLVLLIFVMTIGASPSGTGGGVKNTTVSVMIAIAHSVLRGRPDRIAFMNRTIPASRIFNAVAVTILYLLSAFFAIFLLCLTEKNLSFLSLSFEAVSALGTVGLSAGITGDLSVLGKLVLTATMFIGRIGPLTLGLAFFHTKTALDPNKIESVDLVS